MNSRRIVRHVVPRTSRAVKELFNRVCASRCVPPLYIDIKDEERRKERKVVLQRTALIACRRCRMNGFINVLAR